MTECPWDDGDLTEKLNDIQNKLDTLGTVMLTLMDQKTERAPQIPFMTMEEFLALPAHEGPPQLCPRCIKIKQALQKKNDGYHDEIRKDHGHGRRVLN